VKKPTAAPAPVKPKGDAAPKAETKADAPAAETSAPVKSSATTKVTTKTTKTTPRGKKATSRSGTGERTTTGPGGKKTVIEDEFLIEGKLEKPSAYYILRRSAVDFDWARLDATFSPLVLESVQDPLF